MRLRTYPSDKTAAEFLFGLRVSVLAISATILLSMSMLRNIHVYRPLWMQLCAYSVLCLIVGVEGFLVLRRRPWGRLRWVAVALAQACSVASCVSLPAGHAITSADWAFGTVGWIGVLLLLDRPLPELAGFLAVHEGITAANLVLSGAADEANVLNFLAGSLGAIGFPLAAGFAATALRWVARDAERLRHVAEQLRTAERVQDERHEVRRQRYADLSETAVPLLRGLADGVLDTDDPAVRRACWIEAARMRRLFAEADEVPNPLANELTECVDAARRRGIEAEFVVHGQVPDASVEIRRALAEIPLAVLATAARTARVTLICTEGVVSVNVVSDSGPINLPRLTGLPVEVDELLDGDMLWVEARWKTGQSQR